MRFLLSRRWLVFFLVVALGAWGAYLLGQWQFHRLEDRKASNRIVATNLAEPPVPADELLTVGSGPSPRDEWRRVTVRGTWDTEHSIVLKYQTRDGRAGVDVVTPLRTGDAAVLVDRGWMATQNTGARPKLPPASSGTVTVTGYVRVDGTGDATRVDQLSARAISSRAIGAVLPYRLYGGFLDLAAESPTPEVALEPTELPDDTSNGPHFFYGLQWWFFGVLAVFGFFFLMYDEWRRSRAQPAGSQSMASQPPLDPAVDRQHHAGHV